MSHQESIDVKNGSGASVTVVETSKLLPWLMLVCLMSGFALAGVVFGAILYGETERECRLAQLEIDDFRIALTKAGIELEAHKP